MVKMAYILTFVLVILYFAASVIYLCINALSTLAPSLLESRLAKLRKIVKYAIIGCLAFALLTGLFAPEEQIEVAIASSSFLYMIIAIASILILLTAAVLVIIKLVSKDDIAYGAGIGKLLKGVVVCTVVSILLSWLLS
ncbi:MAG: hypothetical protein IJW13_04770 [Clostridia bacterium]|nr:hypothetical protein [Clostridia bacterium]